MKHCFSRSLTCRRRAIRCAKTTLCSRPNFQLLKKSFRSSMRILRQSKNKGIRSKPKTNRSRMTFKARSDGRNPSWMLLVTSSSLRLSRRPSWPQRLVDCRSSSSKEKTTWFHLKTNQSCWGKRSRMRSSTMKRQAIPASLADLPSCVRAGKGRRARIRRNSEPLTLGKRQLKERRSIWATNAIYP